MLTLHAAQTPRPQPALSPPQGLTPHGSEDGFEIIDEGYASDALSHRSWVTSQPSRDAAISVRAVMQQPRVPGHVYAPHEARVPEFRPDDSAALALQQAQRDARQRELATYERFLLPIARLSARHSPSQLRCPLTHQLLTAIARPVLVRRHQHFSIFDETAFLRWWLDNGTEPISGRRTALMALYRPQIQTRT